MLMPIPHNEDALVPIPLMMSDPNVTRTSLRGIQRAISYQMHV